MPLDYLYRSKTSRLPGTVSPEVLRRFPQGGPSTVLRARQPRVYLSRCVLNRRRTSRTALTPESPALHSVPLPSTMSDSGGSDVTSNVGAYALRALVVRLCRLGKKSQSNQLDSGRHQDLARCSRSLFVRLVCPSLPVTCSQWDASPNLNPRLQLGIPHHP
jgi:hypothetical protein